MKGKRCNGTFEFIDDVTDYTQARLCLDIISEPENRGFTHAEDSGLIKVIYKSYRSGRQSFSILKETILNVPSAFSFYQYNMFYETFNRRIEQMLSNGVIQRMTADYENPKLYKLRPEEIGPQVLTLDHIGVGFLVCLIPMSFAVIVFAIEVNIPRTRIRKLNKQLKHTLVAFFVARTFITNKHSDL